MFFIPTFKETRFSKLITLQHDNITAPLEHKSDLATFLRL